MPPVTCQLNLSATFLVAPPAIIIHSNDTQVAWKHESQVLGEPRLEGRTLSHHYDYTKTSKYQRSQAATVATAVF